MTAARAAWAQLSWDVAAELRRPVATAGVLLFAAASLVLLHLSLAGGSSPDPGVRAGALWIVLLYGALLSSARALAAERESGTWELLVAAPVSRTALLLAKAASAAASAVLLHLAVVPLYFLLFGAPAGAGAVALVVGAVLLADLGFAIVGTLVGAITMRARGRELLAGGMLVPLAMPLVVAAVTLTLSAYGAAPGAAAGQLLGFLALYDLTFLAVAVALLDELAVE